MIWNFPDQVTGGRLILFTVPQLYVSQTITLVHKEPPQTNGSQEPKGHVVSLIAGEMPQVPDGAWGRG